MVSQQHVFEEGDMMCLSCSRSHIAQMTGTLVLLDHARENDVDKENGVDLPTPRNPVKPPKPSEINVPLIRYSKQRMEACEL